MSRSNGPQHVAEDVHADDAKRARPGRPRGFDKVKIAHLVAVSATRQSGRMNTKVSDIMPLKMPPPRAPEMATARRIDGNGEDVHDPHDGHIGAAADEAGNNAKQTSNHGGDKDSKIPIVREIRPPYKMRKRISRPSSSVPRMKSLYPIGFSRFSMLL